MRCCLAPATAVEMEKDLRFLLLRNTYHGVLYYASRFLPRPTEARSPGNMHNQNLQNISDLIAHLQSLQLLCFR